MDKLTVEECFSLIVEVLAMVDENYIANVETVINVMNEQVISGMVKGYFLGKGYSNATFCTSFESFYSLDEDILTEQLEQAIRKYKGSGLH